MDDDQAIAWREHLRASSPLTLALAGVDRRTNCGGERTAMEYAAPPHLAAPRVSPPLMRSLPPMIPMTRSSTYYRSRAMSDVKGRAREALAGITPGPWEVADEIDGVRAGRPTVVKATHSDGYFAGRKSRVVTVDQTRSHFGDRRTEKGQDEANVAFIAAAPALVADLLSLVEEQERQLQAIDKLAVDYPCGYAMGGTVDYDDLRAILDSGLPTGAE